MKESIRVAIAVLAILALSLPVAYVGGEGLFYVASGESYFPEGSAYRRFYAPLDSLSERCPGLWNVRANLATRWVRLFGYENQWVIVAPMPPVFLSPSNPSAAPP